jgi:hypothetical protein
MDIVIIDWSIWLMMTCFDYLWNEAFSQVYIYIYIYIYKMVNDFLIKQNNWSSWTNKKTIFVKMANGFLVKLNILSTWTNKNEILHTYYGT